MTDVNIVLINDGKISPTLARAVLHQVDAPVTHVVTGPDPWEDEPISAHQITLEQIPDNPVVLVPSTSSLVPGLLARGLDCLGLDTALMPLRIENTKEIAEVPDAHPALEDPDTPTRPTSDKAKAVRNRAAKKIAQKKAETPPVEAPETPVDRTEDLMRETVAEVLKHADKHVLLAILVALEEKGLF